MALDLDLTELVNSIKERAGDARFMVALAGPPGAGKSTTTEALLEAFGPEAVCIPMDGYHLSNEELDAMGQRHRKGAPHTFDAESLLEMLKAVRAGKEVDVPGFDRDADATVPAMHHVDKRHRVVIIEGNYLLLDAPVWREMATLFDFTIRLVVPREELKRRLMDRWLGLGMDEAAARAKVEGNDLPNADVVISQSLPADIDLDLTTNLAAE